MNENEKKDEENYQIVRIFTFDELLLYLLKQIEEEGRGNDNMRDMIKRLEEGESLWHTLF